MSKRRKIILLLLVIYLLGLVWGQLRLPVAAIKSLADYPMLRDKVLSVSEDRLQMLPIQKWYLKRFMNVVDGTNVPRVSAGITWNWGIVARVHSGHYMSSTGAEGVDALYVCVFGAWLRVNTFSRVMA